MAVSWGFAMVLVVTTVALFTFSQPLFQVATPEEAVRGDVETILQVAAVPHRYNLLVSELICTVRGTVANHLQREQQARDADASSSSSSSSSSTSAAWSSFDFLQRRTSRRRQRQTRKLVQHQPPGVVDRQPQVPGQSTSPAKPGAPVTRRSVLASFQSDRMVPTGPNPLHNSNRSQVVFP